MDLKLLKKPVPLKKENFFQLNNDLNNDFPIPGFF